MPATPASVNSSHAAMRTMFGVTTTITADRPVMPASTQKKNSLRLMRMFPAPEGRPSIARGANPWWATACARVLAPEGRPSVARRGNAWGPAGVVASPRGYHPWLLTAAPPGLIPITSRYFAAAALVASAADWNRSAPVSTASASAVFCGSASTPGGGGAGFVQILTPTTTSSASDAHAITCCNTTCNTGGTSNCQKHTPTSSTQLNG